MKRPNLTKLRNEFIDALARNQHEGWNLVMSPRSREAKEALLAALPDKYGAAFREFAKTVVTGSSTTTRRIPRTPRAGARRRR